jgi:hypothetical protein
MVHIASILTCALTLLGIADAKAHKAIHRLRVERPMRPAGGDDCLLALLPGPMSEHLAETAVIVEAPTTVAWTPPVNLRRVSSVRCTAPAAWADPRSDFGVVCLT